jgi:isohexenylglutaconyl-CoA hydratase
VTLPPSPLPDCRWLTAERRGFTLHVTMNRPEARNAMILGMAQELSAVFAAVADDRTIGAIVLRGAGKHFSAGGDLKDIFDAIDKPEGENDPLYRTNRFFGDLLMQVDAQPQVVIAVVQGAARGGAFGLACVSDVVIARSDATFAMPETGLGLPAAQIIPFVAARLGPHIARRLAFTGIPMDAAEAHRLGLLFAVADDEAGMDAALASVLAAVKERAPGAVAQAKALVARVGRDATTRILDDGGRAVAESARRGEGAEGLKAFVEKRKPKWTEREG